jgi:hypothetical protein
MYGSKKKPTDMTPKKDMSKVTPEDKKKQAEKLMKSSESKKKAASQQEALGRAQIKNKVKPGQTGVSLYKDHVGQPYPVGKERLDIAKKMRAEASKDSLKAVKLYPPITPKKSKK